MNTKTTPTIATSNSRPLTLYMSFELAAQTWKLAFSDGRSRPRFISMPARDLARLADEMRSAKERFTLPSDCRVVSCYEAGQDGFWLHRQLVAAGIENVIVDSASIEVNRRRRRAKTDRLDARKLVLMLLRHDTGEPNVWSILRVPTVEQEDLRHIHRDLEQLKTEEKQHRMRIHSLLMTQGLRVFVNKSFIKLLPRLRLPNGEPVPPYLRARLEREYRRFELVYDQQRELEGQREEMLRETAGAPAAKQLEMVRRLSELRGIGIGGAWLLVMEFFGWRDFSNRRQVGAAAGLAPTPYSSGDSEREQGISKAGNRAVRWMMVQLGWSWLRHQPNSSQSRWFLERFGDGRRSRRRGIVAVARRLLIALWRYSRDGVVPDGAVLKAAA
jgi:transposase